MIYTKDINGRQVFSSCTTIELNGRWVSNPTEEQISEAGWSKYTPPAVTATPMSKPSQEELLDAVLGDGIELGEDVLLLQFEGRDRKSVV